jgi:hypothetical protein
MTRLHNDAMTVGDDHYRDGCDSCYADAGGIAQRVAFFVDTIEDTMFTQASGIT